LLLENTNCSQPWHIDGFLAPAHSVVVRLFVKKFVLSCREKELLVVPLLPPAGPLASLIPGVTLLNDPSALDINDPETCAAQSLV
jgi:hypothetical protein